MLTTIEQQIWNWAEVQPDKIAVKSGKQSATYKKLCRRILAANELFADSFTCKKGDTVILAAGKQIEFIYAYFGAHLAGLKVVPIDAATNPTRLSYILEQTKANMVVGFETTVSEIKSVSLKEFSDKEVEFYEPLFPSSEDVADILFTSGSTGKPKGVPLTFANEAAAARNINEFIANTKDDVELLALPVSHSFGLGRVRCCLVKGSTLILLGSFANVKKIYKTLEEENVTGFTMVPASWRYLQKLTPNKLSEYTDQLKYIEMGSAYFSKEEKHELASLLPNTRVCMHYGLTEASRSAFMEFHKDALALESVGKASPNTDIQVFDDSGKVLGINQEGEICVKGEHVTKGYLNIPASESYFADYFRTGDWGYINSQGYLYLISRKKELINVGGKKVSPFEVEEQLIKVDGIADCACIGIPDEEGILGEVVKAFIVKEEGSSVSFDDIRVNITGKLESYKLPVLYEWIDVIPKTQNGKIQRGLLK